MAIEIVDLLSCKIVIFHSYVSVSQRVNGRFSVATFDRKGRSNFLMTSNVSYQTSLPFLRSLGSRVPIMIGSDITSFLTFPVCIPPTHQTQYFNLNTWCLDLQWSMVSNPHVSCFSCLHHHIFSLNHLKSPIFSRLIHQKLPCSQKKSDVFSPPQVQLQQPRQQRCQRRRGHGPRRQRRLGKGHGDPRLHGGAYRLRHHPAGRGNARKMGLWSHEKWGYNGYITNINQPKWYSLLLDYGWLWMISRSINGMVNGWVNETIYGMIGGWLMIRLMGWLMDG